MAERSGVERVIGTIDVVRGVGGAIVILVIAVACLRSGGTAGYALGASLVVLLVVGGAWEIRRLHRRRA